MHSRMAELSFGCEPWQQNGRVKPTTNHQEQNAWGYPCSPHIRNKINSPLSASQMFECLLRNMEPIKPDFLLCCSSLWVELETKNPDVLFQHCVWVPILSGYMRDPNAWTAAFSAQCYPESSFMYYWGNCHRPITLTSTNPTYCVPITNSIFYVTKLKTAGRHKWKQQ